MIIKELLANWWPPWSRYIFKGWISPLTEMGKLKLLCFTPLFDLATFGGHIDSSRNSSRHKHTENLELKTHLILFINICYGVYFNPYLYQLFATYLTKGVVATPHRFSINKGPIIYNMTNKSCYKSVQSPQFAWLSGDVFQSPTSQVFWRTNTAGLGVCLSVKMAL